MWQIVLGFTALLMFGGCQAQSFENPETSGPFRQSPAPSLPVQPREVTKLCPVQVQPVMPQRALREGASGVVRAQFKIINGNPVDVVILSGPRVFHEPVIAALMKYKCINHSEEIVATQEFVFRLSDTNDVKVRYIALPNGSVYNLLQYQKRNLIKFSIDSVESGGSYSDPVCRLGKNKVIDLNGKSPAEFIGDAFNLELINAGAFSPRVFLSLTVDAMEFSSLLEGYWGFMVTFSSSTGESARIGYRFPFKAGISSSEACSNGTVAFLPAIKELIFKTLSDSNFQKLVMANGSAN